MKRRDFIKATAIAAPVISLFPADLSAITRKTIPGMIEKRSLGKTGEMLSMIGFGGIIVKDAISGNGFSIGQAGYRQRYQLF